MKHCDKCKVNVVGTQKLCPLCQGKLSGNDSRPDEFPQIESIYKKFNFFFKIMILISIIVASVSIALNVLLPKSGAWSVFVLGAMLSVWVSLITAINKRNNIPKNIIYQTTIISVAAVIWDFVTHWKGWSISYVIPFVCIAAMISMSVISKLMKLHIEDFILYIIIDGLYGIVPVIFIMFGNLRVLYPSVICIATSVISLSAILIFEGESMRSEIKRRLHM